VIVFHDSEKAFKNLEYALPVVLDKLSKWGYLFKAGDRPKKIWAWVENPGPFLIRTL
jgi:hypothetical protein